MSEIDVSKCEYYNDYYKTCSNFFRFDDEPYCDPKEFKCSYYVNNVEKQLQQLKVENEELIKKLDYCFEDNSSDYDKFCDVCVAKDTCNGNCCYNQIKEMFGYEI